MALIANTTDAIAVLELEKSITLARLIVAYLFGKCASEVIA